MVHRRSAHPRTTRGLRSERGFTISELVLVVVLVAALVLVAITSVRGIRKETALSNCQSELRTLKSATLQYQSELGTYPADESVLLDADRVSRADIAGWTMSFGPGDTAPSYETTGADCG